jgi:transcriptional regulator with PAS, ATPase and Fis domain
MIDKLTRDDYYYYLENVYGVVVIDMTGKVIYMNEQCAGYLGVDKEQSIGRKIKDVFPETKMMEGLKLEKPNVFFYQVLERGSASIHIPLWKNGIKVGLMEYDLFQALNMVDEFLDNYKIFQSEELKYYKEEIMNLRNAKYSIQNIVGSSEKIATLKSQIRYAARTNSTVLITGETGTGKELVAHAIHNLSDRKLKEFIRINASAFPENLAESELFGYDEGSFTGAKKTGKKGKFELANSGTLFIDEIHQMPLNLQPKILRALQEKEIDRIGGEKSIPVDVRIIAATNMNLSKLVQEKKFREDLYYRLNVVEIFIPPLRERMEDLPELIESIISQMNNILGTHVTSIEPEVIKLLGEYDWPGNVRELQNIIERAMNFADSNILKKEHFDFSFYSGFTKGKNYTDVDNPIEEAKKQAEKALIIHTLKKFENNKTKAAKYLKISRPLLYQKINRLNIK